MNSLWKEKSVQFGLVAALILGAIGGLTMGWKLWRPRVVTEVSAPGYSLPGGGQVLPKEPNSEAKPAQPIPRGAVVERIVYVNAQPHTQPVDPLPVIPGSGVTDPPAQPSLKPAKIRIDMTLFRLPDGTKRVTVSSPDADITGGMDIPVEAARPVPKELKWAGGFEYAVGQWGDTKSLVVQRDIGWLRLGARAGKVVLTTPTGVSLNGAEVGISAMIRW